MKPFHRVFAALAAGVLATACSSVPTRTFTFDAINASEEPQPALVVVDGDWDKAWEGNQVVNVQADDALTLTIPFASAEVDITVVPLTVVTKGGNKEAGSQVRSRKEATDKAGMTDDVRNLQIRDPQLQMFVLTRTRAGAN